MIQLGRRPEGLAALTRAHALFLSTLGEQHGLTGRCASELAAAQAETGRD